MFIVAKKIWAKVGKCLQQNQPKIYDLMRFVYDVYRPVIITNLDLVDSFF